MKQIGESHPSQTARRMGHPVGPVVSIGNDLLFHVLS
jgi:hypothetical protein